MRRPLGSERLAGSAALQSGILFLPWGARTFRSAIFLFNGARAAGARSALVWRWLPAADLKRDLPGAPNVRGFASAGCVE